MYAYVNLGSSAEALGAQIEALPPHLKGLDETALGDLSWTDPALGHQGHGYWLVREHYPTLGAHEHYADPILVADQPQRVIERQWAAVPLSGEALAARLSRLLEQAHQAVEDELNRRIRAGVPYSFPDGQTGSVQLRNDRDQSNVQAVASAGNALVTLGDTSSKVAFRDGENVTHTMTGAEAVAFGLFVMNAIAALYAAAWAHKDAIKQLAEAGDLEGLEAYDLSGAWPPH